MKIMLQQNEKVKEIEVTIVYDRMNDRLKELIQTIHQYEGMLTGTAEEKTYILPLEQLFYAEATDGRTFLYTKDRVYESAKNLSLLEQEFQKSGLLRIGKGCLMNVTRLKSVAPYPNHRLLAELVNGEKLIVSRKYIPKLQDVVRRSYNG